MGCGYYVEWVSLMSRKTIQQLIVRFRMLYVGNYPRTTIRSSEHISCSGSTVKTCANGQSRAAPSVLSEPIVIMVRYADRFLLGVLSAIPSTFIPEMRIGITAALTIRTVPRVRCKIGCHL